MVCERGWHLTGMRLSVLALAQGGCNLGYPQPASEADALTTACLQWTEPDRCRVSGGAGSSGLATFKVRTNLQGGSTIPLFPTLQGFLAP